MQLRGVGMHRPQIGADAQLEANISRKCVSRNFANILSQLSQVGALRGSFHASGKSQHLTDERRPASSGVLDGVQNTQRFLAAQLFSQHFYRHQNGSQHIVQIMGNAAGQGADAFHALGAQHLLLQLLALGNVGFDVQHALGISLSVFQQRPAGQHR